ncbi:hypothetical protein [Jiangella sp. DSM 45060]|uniref:hypothetical protein n=1 Tax=Jiangella sp. DSM 45060 TaxID=1798224 RepID=UPI00087AAC88|nr:hypothetical protein [Jiangella sp. DSM 45060]SDT63166.1 hypothetical protein SAMN04515669_5266 [Jiangella sp. DSM 45060]
MRRALRGTAALALTAAGLWAATLPAAASEDDVDRYLDEVAVELAEPGVWVDPDAAGAFGSAEAAELDEAAAAAPVGMRIAVVPAWRLDPEGQERLFGRTLLYEGEELASQLYDRVGVDGVYLVMSVADSSYDGRGLWGVQHSEEGPTYYVEDAIDQAVDCCAPDYGPMIDRFIDRASDVDHPLYIDLAPWAGGAAGIAGVWWGGTTLSARRRRQAEEQRHLEVVRPLLTEEVIELSDRVSDLPTTSDIEQAKLTKEILDTVEKARHRLDQAATDDDVQAVTSLLGSARYRIACLTALQQGRPVPEPTPPCFFDPRHGPSTQERQWTPEHGVSRDVPLCDQCAVRLDAGEAPQARQAGRGSYWEGGEDLVAYIEGYWNGTAGTWRFPHNDHSVARGRLRSRWESRRPRARLASYGRSLSKAASSAMSSSGDGSGGSGGWGGGSGGRSRRRSFGGGSSRRSSRRSGGGRRF